jgi:hypothetical protein
LLPAVDRTGADEDICPQYDGTGRANGGDCPAVPGPGR